MPYGESYTEEQYDRDSLPQTVPAGVYRARVKEVTAERVDGNRCPMANVAFLITQGDMEGQMLFRRFVIPVVDDVCREAGGLTDAQKMNYNRFLAPFLDAIGAPAKGIAPDKWIGEEIWIRVDVEEYDGSLQSKIVGYASSPEALTKGRR